jgi:hypothetical protein
MRQVHELAKEWMTKFEAVLDDEDVSEYVDAYECWRDALDLASARPVELPPMPHELDQILEDEEEDAED